MTIRMIEPEYREGDVARIPGIEAQYPAKKAKETILTLLISCAVFFGVIGYLIGNRTSDTSMVEQAIKQARQEERAKVVAEIKEFGRIEGMQVAYVNVSNKTQEEAHD